VDRVLRYWGAQEGWGRSLAAMELLASDFELQYANRESQDPRPEVLSPQQDQTLMAFLVASFGPAVAGAGLRWQDVRNRTGVALQRGAGLTPLELRLLQVSSVCVDADPVRGAWKVRVPATGSVQAHEAPVAKWARPIVAVWLQRRADELVQGDWLLPSTRTGKPWGKTSQFDSVAEVLEAADLMGFKGGSYLLRNTFAVRQLARPKVTPETVADWMGIDVREMTRYLGVLV
jgi:integrase